MRKLAYLALVLVCGAVLRGHAFGDGVAGVMEAKTIPEATIQVIDPESGTSSGGGTTDVKVAVGDIILFRFRIFPVPDKIVHGLQGYLTDYIPDNTQVVGVRLIDANGVTVPPEYPGLATNGCARPCNGFNSVPGAGGDRNLQDGSISQVYADTGIFYSTDARLARNPAASFITLGNGITMSPEPRYVGNVSGILGTSSPFYAHNAWDWIQVRAYGVNTAAAENGGTGNTPYRYGSPVAGTGAWYNFEASEPTAGNIQFNDVVGPWIRVAYPGSQIGSGAAVTGNGPLLRMNVDTTAGVDLTPLSPLPVGTRAVRIATGEIRVGEPRYAEIALRVLGTPLDTVQNADVNCAEMHGGDTSAASDTVRAKDNAWGIYLASPACVFLNLLFDLTVDKPLAATGDTLVYTLHGKNLSINPQNNVVRRLRYDSTRVAFVSATGGPTNLGTCDDGSGMACLRWPTVTLAPSEEYTFTATFTVGGGGHVTAVAFANYRSTQLPAPGYTTQATSMTKEVAVVRASLAAPLAGGVAGGTVAMTGTISNAGSGAGSYDTLTVVLPTGWRVTGALTLGGSTLTCTSGCAGSTPTYNIAASFGEAEVRNLAFNVLIPAGAATGLYDVDLQIWGSMTGFGGAFETYFPNAATVSVGQGRSDAPVVSCPVVKDDTTISGTTTEADGTVIKVFFNGIFRCTTTASGGVWSCTGYVGTFGPLYGGLEIRATADGPTELEGPLSAPCFVSNVPMCSDFMDNDGDGLTDFPADPGCSSPGDSSEADAGLQCSDSLDNDADTFTDWPADLSCYGPDDPTESGAPACGDGVDNDGDGLTDFPADPDCGSATDANEITLPYCMDWLDNDGDGLADFPDDPGCVSAFDDDEGDPLFSPGDVKARLLIAFDTSGSMNWNTCSNTFTGGDGSASCAGSDVSCATCSASGCGNGIADDSRMYKVKKGVSDVVAAFGEVDYALMRFHQRPVTFACPSQNASMSSGGWQGGGAAPCSGGFDSGDLLVSFDPENQYDILGWMDGSTNYAGVPPATLDWELRGSGTTPLAGILDSALAYLGGVQAGDAQATCRPYRVILVTDGGETCGGDPVASATALLAAGIPTHVIGFATPDASVIANLNAIAAAGGTGSAIFAGDSTTLSTAMASIVTSTILVELCNGLDDDCDGMIDEDFPNKGQACTNGQLGECLRNGTFVCTTDQFGTECNAPSVVPGSESCNGLDDDCNGLVDDGVVCPPPCIPQPEVCNGADDDCDTIVDEDVPSNNCGSDIGACAFGSTACVAGALVCQGGTGPTTESCNNIDDDCDTIVDGFGEPCYEFASGCVLGTGVCLGLCQIGNHICTTGSFGPCVGDIGPVAEVACNDLDDDCDGSVDENATTEVCDTIDNDCDGLIDESDPSAGASCGTPPFGVGPCVAGALVCQSGALVCVGEVNPVAEACNNVDDDCDGSVDEGIAGFGGACGNGTGECTPGTLQCVAGAPQCVGAVGPTPEVCDCLDNDCDGASDETDPGVGASCQDLPGGGTVATEVGECQYGVRICDSGSCGLICAGVVGPAAEVCNGLDDDCDGAVDDGFPAETCNGVDDDCDGAIDETDPALGTACGTPPFTAPCAQGTMACVGGALVCQGELDPQAEVCDNKDNDCDGTPDDGAIPGYGGPCGTGTGECTAGTLQCVSGAPSCVGFIGPTAEVCDCLDNNCNGVTDESDPATGTICQDLPGGGTVVTEVGECQYGVRICDGTSCGMICSGAVGPAPEICDGRDNDCNGLTDDGFPAETCNGVDDNCNGFIDEADPALGTACGTPPFVGTCKQGALACVAGGLTCVGEVDPVAEICDNKDNDCNGSVDDGAIPGFGGACGNSTGICEPGVFQCVGGAGVCVGGTPPATEVCNCLDDNCNGFTDEIDPMIGTACNELEGGGTVLVETGVCQFGALVCDAVACGLDCVGAVGPSPEACNGLDDDCNGLTDDGLPSEVCDGVDNDCDGLVDESDPQLGVACGTPPFAGACSDGAIACVGGTLTCLGEIDPIIEACNGIDDDCNGSVDDGVIPGFGGACGNTIGACEPGVLTCVGGAPSCVGAIGPTPEVCDCVDNDCDSFTDEADPGVGTSCGATDVGECAFGINVCDTTACGLACIGEIGPAPETCNGRDDDCDAATDEDFPTLGATCNNGLLGACLVTGVFVCLPDGSGVTCTAPPGAPSTEICNGIDDDCDGTVDELPMPIIGTECAPPIGICSPGLWQCVAGAPVCGPGGTGVLEICNSLDDDCDGATDETTPPLPGTGEACYPVEWDGCDVETATCLGLCALGATQCIAGSIDCVGAIGPQAEVCNGLDDDCDGVADDMAPCPMPDDICHQGECIRPCCAESTFPCEFPCPGGFACIDVEMTPLEHYCVPDPCLGKICPGGQYCDPQQDGACIDPCNPPGGPAVMCPDGQLCAPTLSDPTVPECVSCFDSRNPCPAGEQCVNDGGAIGCQDIPCDPNPCADPEDVCVVIGGVEQCQHDCTGECDPGTRCDLESGMCVDDLCYEAECAEGQICDPNDGQCKNPQCTDDVVCPLGQICDQQTGDCVDDLCPAHPCPMDYHCEIYGGEPTCVHNEIAEPPPPELVWASGGGGCTCRIGATRAAPGGALALLSSMAGMLFLVTRRRGRKGGAR